MATLTSQIASLIAYANETTGKADTKLGDAVKSLADGYKGGGTDYPLPTITDADALPSKLTALIAYSNGITGKADATIGDAVRSLVEGYSKVETEQVTIKYKNPIIKMGYTLDENGALVKSTWMYYADYIEICGESFVARNGYNYRYALYSDKNEESVMLVGVNNGYAQTIKIPQGAKYIRFTIQGNESYNMVLTVPKGSVPQ